MHFNELDFSPDLKTLEVIVKVGGRRISDFIDLKLNYYFLSWLKYENIFIK